MATLCFVTTCMGRLTELRRTLGRMAAQPDASCVVVDYSCPDGSGDWAEAHAPAARVVRLPGRRWFNASEARNSGAAAADAPWLCFVDSDVVLDPGFAAAVVPSLAPGGYYRAGPGDPGLGGTFACARSDFDRAGGYDEAYRCWGEEDNDLYDALQFLGLRERGLPTHLLTHLAHGDDRRTRYYPTADIRAGHAVNRVYRILKWDAARLRRELLAPAMRREMYDKVAEVVGAALREGKAGELTIHLPPGIVPGGGSLARSMTYRLTVPG